MCPSGISQGGSFFIAIGGPATFNGEVDFIDNSSVSHPLPWRFFILRLTMRAYADCSRSDERGVRTVASANCCQRRGHVFSKKTAFWSCHSEKPFSQLYCAIQNGSPLVVLWAKLWLRRAVVHATLFMSVHSQHAKHGHQQHENYCIVVADRILPNGSEML